MVFREAEQRFLLLFLEKEEYHETNWTSLYTSTVITRVYILCMYAREEYWFLRWLRIVPTTGHDDAGADTEGEASWVYVEKCRKWGEDVSYD
jgi:hypothetical protein